jgi:hypothetical protein
MMVTAVVQSKHFMDLEHCLQQFNKVTQCAELQH